MSLNLDSIEIDQTDDLMDNATREGKTVLMLQWLVAQHTERVLPVIWNEIEFEIFLIKCFM